MADDDSNRPTEGDPAASPPAPADPLAEAPAPTPAATLDEAAGELEITPSPPPVDAGNANGGSATEVVDYKFSQTQRDLAFRLVWILIAVIVVIMLVSVTYSVDCWRNADDVGEPCGSAGAALTLLTNSLSPIFTAMIGLVGSVVGFYFGSKKS